MAIWNVNEIAREIVVAETDASVLITRGEDYTTSGMDISLPGIEDRLYVRGFVHESPIGCENEVDVELVEVTNGYSEGGLTSSEEPMIDLYATVRKVLARKGFIVVATLDSYF